MAAFNTFDALMVSEAEVCQLINWLYVSSSIGRATVSKTVGCRFDAYLTCHFAPEAKRLGKGLQNPY